MPRNACGPGAAGRGDAVVTPAAPTVADLHGVAARPGSVAARLLPWVTGHRSGRCWACCCLRPPNQRVARVRHRRLQDGARLVTVLAPPRPDPDGAAALWGNLAGLLRPRWRRLLFGQPHLCFEYHLTAQRQHDPDLGTRPDPTRPGRTRHHRRLARRHHPHHPHPASRHAPTSRPGAAAGDDRWGVAAGPPHRAAAGRTDPRGPDHRPARRRSRPRPHAPLAGAAPSDGEIVVQVLARPVPTRSAPARRPRRRAGRHAGAGRDGDAAVDRPGVPRPRRTHPSPRRTLDLAGGRLGSAGPAGALRAGTGPRSRKPATPPSTPSSATPPPHLPSTPPNVDPIEERALRAAARGRVRGRAHAVAAVFASFTGHNHYRRHHLLFPHHAIAGRRMRHGDRLSVGELA